MLETIVLLPIFVLMSVWWWLLLAAASCVMIWSLEGESFFGATFTFLATIVLMTVFGSERLLEYMFSGWGSLVVILGYLGCGVIWAFIKWYLFLTKRRAKYIELRDKWLIAEGIEGNVVPEAKRRDWLKWLADHTDFASHKYLDREITLTLVPRVSESKTKIILWMSYWPWSLIWTLIADLIKRVFEHLYNMIAGWLQAVSDWVFSGIRDF